MPTFTGTPGADTLNGAASDDVVDGLAGNDVLDGGAGNDTLMGGDGDDSLLDESGSDQLLGGAGADFIQVNHLSVAPTGAQRILVDGGDGDDIIRVFANGALQNPAAPTPMSATILGGDGDDAISTRNDMALSVDAGTGNDNLIISGMHDHSAMLTLGAGADTVTLQNAGGWTGVATITDFQTGAGGDRLNIDPDLYILNWDHSTNPFSLGYFRLEQVGADTVLQVDFDGSGSAGTFQDLVRFQNTQAGAFTAFNLFDWAPSGQATPGGALIGTAGADDLSGGTGADSIQGLAGNDFLQGQAGDDTVDGGDGDDQIEGGPGSDSLSGGAGDDILLGASMTHDPGLDTLSGGDGNDTLTAGDGASLLDGGAGNDNLTGGQGPDHLTGDAGNDFILGGAGDDTIDGGAGDDILQGGLGHDVITTGGGADKILIASGETDARSMSGLDVVTDWSANAKIEFTDNIGFVRAGTYSETTATDYASAVSAAQGHFGSGGSDIVAVQVGSDVIVFVENGGLTNGVPGGVVLEGRSLADISAENVVGSVDGGTFTATPGSPPPVTGLPAPVGGVQNGTDGPDVIAATSSVSEIHAGSGADTVAGGPPQDYLRGDDGDDSIQGGAGFDDINGNKGNDTISGDLTTGSDWLVGGQNNDSITAHAGANLVYGNLGADTLQGGNGADVIRGGQGDDVLTAGSGNQFLSGDRGDDTVTAGSGNDTIHSSQDAGIDRILGFNPGHDVVEFDPGTQFSVAQVGADTVITMIGSPGTNEVILVGVQMTSLTGAWVFEG